MPKGLPKAVKRAFRAELKRRNQNQQAGAQFIGMIPHKAGQEIRVRWTRFQDKRRLDIRLFVTDAKGRMIPTRKGVAITEDLLNDFFAILDSARTGTMPRPESN